VRIRVRDLIAIIILICIAFLLYAGKINLEVFTWVLGMIMGYYFREFTGMKRHG